MSEYILPKGVTPEKMILKSAEDENSEEIVLWKGSHNYFNEKDLAELELAESRKCQICGKPTLSKHYLNCEDCKLKIQKERYLSMPYKKWDDEGPVCLYYDDVYFFDEGDVFDYAEQNDIQVSNLMLCTCEKVPIPTIDFQDYLDDVGDLDFFDSGDVEGINDKINDVIKSELEEHWHIWQQGKYRTSLEE